MLLCEEEDEEDDEEEIEWVAEIVDEGGAATAHGEHKEGKATGRPKQREEGKAAAKVARRKLKRTYLRVPFMQKDQAKALGAR